VIRARYVTAGGERKTSLLLTSGWWGVARHFHYVPELAAAFLWCAPAGFAQPLPYFYFFFLVPLLVDRAARDDARCRSKYGAAWEEYCARVPYRMLPYVY
jgi:7-dehydrocholesterol reductase